MTTSGDKAVVVEGWSASELERILAHFGIMYRKELAGFRLGFFTNANVHRISLPDDLLARLLPYLVNYIHYPEAFEVDDRSIVAVGVATLTKDFHAPADEQGKRAHFYVPTDDEEFDLVYIRVDDRTYELPFSEMKWKRVSEPRLSPAARLLRA